MSLPAFDPLAALRTLLTHAVRFVVIGGFASRLHGAPLVTNDLDICYERTDENLERLVKALVDLQAKLGGAPPEVPFLLDRQSLRLGDHLTFITSAGALDCLGTPTGTGGFEDLHSGAVTMDLDGIRVRVACLDDLIRMKQRAGRPKDLYQAEVLGALRDEIEGRGSPG